MYEAFLAFWANNGIIAFVEMLVLIFGVCCLTSPYKLTPPDRRSKPHEIRKTQKYGIFFIAFSLIATLFCVMMYQ